MKDFFLNYEYEILRTIVTIVSLLVLRFIINKTIRRVGNINDYKKARTKLLLRYVNIAVLVIGFLIISLIWSIDLMKLSLLFSSVFAVLGIALFAQWSVLSNITSGVVLFFYFPFKIGDKIKILDKDFPLEAIIEDIRSFNVNLKTKEGELVTYPNSLFIQKAVIILNDYNRDDGSESV